MAGGCVIFKAYTNLGDSPSFLIVCLRFIGDVLVTTPLAASIKTVIPGATVDYLVFEGTESILAKNPHVDNVITMSRGSRSPSLIASLWKKYDVALSTNPSDRMTVFSILAGKKSYGLLYNSTKGWLKKRLLDGFCYYNDNISVVHNVLLLLDLLGIPKQPHVVMGYDAGDIAFAHDKLGESPYIILHPYSRGAYKYWNENKWGALADLINSRLGLRTFFTVTPDTADNAFLKRIVENAPSNNRIESFSQPFSLTQLAAAIKSSVAYIGIDTAVTHLAAAVGAPTIALYGSTYTKYWAPWPNGCSDSAPFAANKGIQRVGNVTVIQKEWPCVPCNRENCLISDRNRMECLEQLTPEEVFSELNNVLGKKNGNGKL